MFDLLEGLVDGSEPTYVGAGSEHEQPDDSQPKVRHTTSTKHPRKATNEIHSQGSAVHLRPENTFRMNRCK